MIGTPDVMSSELLPLLLRPARVSLATETLIPPTYRRWFGVLKCE